MEYLAVSSQKSFVVFLKEELRSLNSESSPRQPEEVAHEYTVFPVL